MFKQRAERIAQGDSEPYVGAKLVEDMEQAIQEADRERAPEDEIVDLMMTAFTITRAILTAKEQQATTLGEQVKTIEEEIADMRTRNTSFAKRLSEDLARSAG